ncbi:MAG TPA: hypothetical protein DCP90_00700 [Clostridiales bacterium]|nr:MAG: hypothetical protein A2Y22_08040 [Clostridiales bacterium GWD2_32_59]HAN09116.1 hypothetical protein [Clostridiales bacterium]
MKKIKLSMVSILIVLTLIGCKTNQGVSDSSVQESEATVKIKDVSKNELDNTDTKEEVDITETSGKVEVGMLTNTFAFADETGKKLITFDAKIEKPEELNVAIGDNGKIFKIKYIMHQNSNDKDTSRQSSSNFDNIAGYIYEVEENEKLETDDTYYLSSNKILNDKI